MEIAQKVLIVLFSKQGVHKILELYSYNNDEDFDILKKSEHLNQRI